MSDDPVLGISCYYHDSAACLVRGCTPLAAAQEERFSRRRHDPSFPASAVAYCLDDAGLTLADVPEIAYYEDPRLKLRRIAATFLGIAPRGLGRFRSALPEWASWKRNAGRAITAELRAQNRGPVPPVRYVPHHESHAASAFLPSPFPSAAVLCIDGVGEWATTSVWHGRGERVDPVAQLDFPHSLGLLYSAFTYFCGFKVDSGEYKLMGLAPYGVPRFADVIRDQLIDVKPDGSFRLDTRHFDFLHRGVIVGRGFERLFGGPRRCPEAELTEREFDLAASVQLVTDEVVGLLAATALRRTGERRLCLAGGVALNCVANGRLVERGVADELWVQPAAGDAGGALGAALSVAARRGSTRRHLGTEPATEPATRADAMAGSLLGPAYDDDRVRARLDAHGMVYTAPEPGELVRTVAHALGAGQVVGWFQGRAEFGPRALGNRSILGDPRDPDMQSTMNLKIKFRESFRPFAPSVLAQDARAYFALGQDSPYMLLVAEVAEDKRIEAPDDGAATGLERLHAVRSVLPAVTHVDFSARVQTVDAAVNPRYAELLRCFKQITGCPVLVNTSFNVRGEPIVNTPDEAVRCFMRTDIDVLAIGSFLLYKREQAHWREDEDWRRVIPLD